MKVIKEKEATVVKMEIDFEVHERASLLAYANKNMPTDEVERLQIEWSLIHLLEAIIDENQ